MPEVFACPNTGLPAVETCGDTRLFGSLPSPAEFRLQAKQFGDHFETMPRTTWPSYFTLRPWAGKTLDQNGQGSCVGHGGCKAFTVAHRKSGAAPLDFSPCFLYGQINGGRDQGAVLSDAIETLAKTGICLESEVGPRVIYKNRFPQSAYETAKKYMAVEYFQVRNLDEIVSAALLGFGVFVGGMIGGNFSDVDSEYRVPKRIAGGGGGHCRTVIGVKKIGGDYLAEELNSWGNTFGNAGVCYVWENYFDEGDNWAIRVASTSPDDPNNPPLVAA
jgi:hypothetical protein